MVTDRVTACTGQVSRVVFTCALCHILQTICRANMDIENASFEMPMLKCHSMLNQFSRQLTSFLWNVSRSDGSNCHQKHDVRHTSVNVIFGWHVVYSVYWSSMSINHMKTPQLKTIIWERGGERAREQRRERERGQGRGGKMERQVEWGQVRTNGHLEHHITSF